MKQSLTLTALCLGAVLNAQIFTNWTTADGLPGNDLRDVAVANDGNIWLATQSGVAMYNGSSFTVHNTTSHPGLANNDVYAIATTINGEVWAGTDFGVSVFNGSSYTTYTTLDGLGDDQVTNIKQAPNGDIWIGTINGATRYSNGTFTAFGSPDIPFGGVQHFAFAPNGDVWMSGGLFGVIVYDGSSFSIINTSNGLISNRIRSIAFDADGNKWIATAEGISVLNSANAHVADHEHVFILPPPDELNPITDILVDSYGRVWAGVYVDYLVTEGGVSMYDGTIWNQWETSDGLAGPNVTRMAMDEDGSLWIATSTGLSRMSGINIGIAEQQQAPAFALFPNPASNAVTLVLEQTPTQRSTFEILDAQARRVAEGLITNERNTIDVSTFEAGVYMARIGSSVQRFVVAR